jgi:hypothetical protein
MLLPAREFERDLSPGQITGGSYAPPLVQTALPA